MQKLLTYTNKILLVCFLFFISGCNNMKWTIDVGIFFKEKKIKNEPLKPLFKEGDCIQAINSNATVKILRVNKRTYNIAFWAENYLMWHTKNTKKYTKTFTSDSTHFRRIECP